MCLTRKRLKLWGECIICILSARCAYVQTAGCGLMVLAFMVWGAVWATNVRTKIGKCKHLEILFQQVCFQTRGVHLTSDNLTFRKLILNEW